MGARTLIADQHDGSLNESNLLSSSTSRFNKSNHDSDSETIVAPEFQLHVIFLCTNDIHVPGAHSLRSHTVPISSTDSARA